MIYIVLHVAMYAENCQSRGGRESHYAALLLPQEDLCKKGVCAHMTFLYSTLNDNLLMLEGRTESH